MCAVDSLIEWMSTTVTVCHLSVLHLAVVVPDETDQRHRDNSLQQSKPLPLSVLHDLPAWRYAGLTSSDRESSCSVGPPTSMPTNVRASGQALVVGTHRDELAVARWKTAT